MQTVLFWLSVVSGLETSVRASVRSAYGVGRGMEMSQVQFQAALKQPRTFIAEQYNLALAARYGKDVIAVNNGRSSSRLAQNRERS